MRLKYLRIIYHRFSFSTKVPTRLKPSLLQPLTLESGMLRRYRCDCWGWCSDVFFSETGRWIECATRKEASFLDLSAPHFSLLLPATWDTALSLRHCSHLGIMVAPAWLMERTVQGKQAWRLCLCHPAPIARLLSGMSYLRMELPPRVAVLYAEFPHAHWIAIPLQLNPIWL